MSYNVVSLDGYITISRALKIYDRIISSQTTVEHEGLTVQSNSLLVPRSLGDSGYIDAAINLSRLIERHNATVECGTVKLMKYMVCPQEGLSNHRFPVFAIRFVAENMAEVSNGSIQDVPVFIGNEYTYMINPFATDIQSAVTIICETSKLTFKGFDTGTVAGTFEIKLNTIGFEIHRAYSNIDNYTHLPKKFNNPVTFGELLKMFGYSEDMNAVNDYLRCEGDISALDFMPIEMKFSHNDNRLMMSRIKHEGSGAGSIKTVERAEFDSADKVTVFDTVMLTPSTIRTSIFQLDPDVFYRDDMTCAIFGVSTEINESNINKDDFYGYITLPYIGGWELDSHTELAGGESITDMLSKVGDNIEIFADKSLRAIKKIPGLPIDVYKWIKSFYRKALKMYSTMKQDSDLDYQDRYLNDEVYPFLEHSINALKAIFIGWFGFLIVGPLAVLIAVLTWIKNKNDFERAQDLMVHKMEAELEVVDKDIQKAESEGDSKKLGNLIRFKHRINNAKNKIVTKKFEKMMS